LSDASSSQGETLPSWSSFVTMTSSPARQSRAAVRVSAKLSVVMFAPKITSSAEQLRKRPASALAWSRICWTRWLVS
jgi:hypothetical protein